MARTKHAVDFSIQTQIERERERETKRDSPMQWLLLALISQISAWEWERRRGNLHNVSSFNQKKREKMKNEILKKS